MTNDISLYVLGFLFDKNYNNVVLIRKKRPAWQAGRLNGIGGKIEPGETSEEAMKREFLEEAGLEVDNWNQFGTMTGEGWHVDLFVTTSPDISCVCTKTDEKVLIYDIYHVVLGDPFNMISNIPWLVSAARDFSKRDGGPIDLTVYY